MTHKILIIDTHPFHNSFGQALAESYEKGAMQTHDVKKIVLRDMNFDPIMNSNFLIEPIIEEHQKLFMWADHVVIETPMWWGSFPALTKGWIDKTFARGIFYKFNENGTVQQLMKGKTLRLIHTYDGPWIYQFISCFLSWRTMKNLIFKFCGFKCDHTPFYNVSFTTPQKRQQMLDDVYKLGIKGE